MHNSTPARNVYGAYYHISGSAWRNFSTSVGINKAVEKLGVAEGEHISVGVVAIPEYYVDEDGSLSAEDVQPLIENGELGDGAYLSTSMLVDNTAPVVADISKSMLSNKLTITARDENYLAAVQVTNLTGKTVFACLQPQPCRAGHGTLPHGRFPRRRWPGESLRRCGSRQLVRRCRDLGCRKWHCQRRFRRSVCSRPGYQP